MKRVPVLPKPERIRRYLSLFANQPRIVNDTLIACHAHGNHQKGDDDTLDLARHQNPHTSKIIR